MSVPDSTRGRDSDRGAYRGPERRKRPSPARVMPVRLTCKYAEVIDGIDLSSRSVGDRLPLKQDEARLLVAEGWAEPVPDSERRRSRPH